MDLKDQDESTADRGMDVRIARRRLLNNLKDIPLANNINMIRTSMKRSWKIGLSIVKYPPRFSFIPTTLHTDINRKAKIQ